MTTRGVWSYRFNSAMEKLPARQKRSSFMLGINETLNVPHYSGAETFPPSFSGNNGICCTEGVFPLEG